MKKKKWRGNRKRGSSLALAFSPRPPPPPRFPGVQFNSPLPSERRALLSERLQQASCSVLAFMSSRFATPPLVSPRNNVWQTSAEITYWWRVATQIWIVLLIGLSKFLARHDQSGALPRSDVINTEFLRSFLRNGETNGAVAKCRHGFSG